MGKVTVFTADECADCIKAIELLSSKGAQLHEISLTKNPDWRPLLFILAEGKLCGFSAIIFHDTSSSLYTFYSKPCTSCFTLFHKSLYQIFDMRKEFKNLHIITSWQVFLQTASINRQTPCAHTQWRWMYTKGPDTGEISCVVCWNSQNNHSRNQFWQNLHGFAADIRNQKRNHVISKPCALQSFVLDPPLVHSLPAFIPSSLHLRTSQAGQIPLWSSSMSVWLEDLMISKNWRPRES